MPARVTPEERSGGFQDIEDLIFPGTAHLRPGNTDVRRHFAGVAFRGGVKRGWYPRPPRPFLGEQMPQPRKAAADHWLEGTKTQVKPERPSLFKGGRPRIPS